MTGRKLIIIVAFVIAAGAWYAFRPERLFINQTVNEQFPTAAAATEAKTLVAGDFHSATR